MRRCIAVLEDNDDRIQAMQRCLADKFPFFEHQFCRTADEQIAWLREHWETTICLCLDHDLEPPAHAPQSDPGTGRDVVDFLVRCEPSFSIVVHTSNTHAAIAMIALLDEHGWTVQRAMPYDDLAWIGELWLPTVRQVIVDAAEANAAVATPNMERNA